MEIYPKEQVRDTEVLLDIRVSYEKKKYEKAEVNEQEWIEWDDVIQFPSPFPSSFFPRVWTVILINLSVCRVVHFSHESSVSLFLFTSSVDRVRKMHFNSPKKKNVCRSQWKMPVTDRPPKLSSLEAYTSRLFQVRDESVRRNLIDRWRWLRILSFAVSQVASRERIRQFPHSTVRIENFTPSF